MVCVQYHEFAGVADGKTAEPIPTERPPASRRSGLQNGDNESARDSSTEIDRLATREGTVSLRIDRDVLEYFQKDGPGWQERISQALRKAAGMTGEGDRDEGLRPDELTSENDQ